MGIKKRLRQVHSTIHLWLGLTLGLYVVAIGLTGAILSFKEPLEAALHPGLYRVAPQPGQRAPLDTVLKTVQAAHPSGTIGSLSMPKESGDTILVRINEGDKTRLAFADPYSANYLGSYLYDGSPVWWVYELHMNLLLREKGGKANGILALAGVALLASGLLLWLPATTQQLAPRLVIKRDAGTKRTLHDLHNVAGVYALPLLLLLFLTGSAFLYYEPVSDFLNAVAGSGNAKKTGSPARATTPMPSAEPLSLETLFAVAQAKVPTGKVSFIQPASKSGTPAQIFFDMPDAWKNAHGVNVSLDPYSGRVTSVSDTHAEPAAGVLRTALNLHFGAWGGMGSHLLYAAAGIAPLVLFITGLYKWQAKRRGLATNRAKRLHASAVP